MKDNGSFAYSSRTAASPEKAKAKETSTNEEATNIAKNNKETSVCNNASSPEIWIPISDDTPNNSSMDAKLLG